MLATTERGMEKYGGAEGYMEVKCRLGVEDFGMVRAGIVDEAKYTTIGQKL